MERCGGLLWHHTRASLTDSNKSCRIIDTKSLSTRDGTMNEFTPLSCRSASSFHPLNTRSSSPGSVLKVWVFVLNKFQLQIPVRTWNAISMDLGRIKKSAGSRVWTTSAWSSS